MRLKPDILSDLAGFRRRAEESVSSAPQWFTKAEKIVDSMSHGIHARKKAGHGEEFWQFRPYASGDRPQDIDWRQSAKGDDAFTRIQEQQNDQTTYMWCSNAPSMGFQSEKSSLSKYDYGALFGLSCALLITHGHERVALWQGKAGRSDTHLHDIAQQLYDARHDLLQSGDDIAVSRVKGAHKIPSHAAFIGIDDFLQPIEHLEQTFDPIAQQTRNGVMVQILDRAEYDLPYDGRVDFYDGRGGDYKTDNVPTIRQEYQERIQNHIKALEHLCSGFGWHCVTCFTDVPMDENLRRLSTVLNDEGDLR